MLDGLCLLKQLRNSSFSSSDSEGFIEAGVALMTGTIGLEVSARRSASSLGETIRVANCHLVNITVGREQGNVAVSKRYYLGPIREAVLATRGSLPTPLGDGKNAIVHARDEKSVLDHDVELVVVVRKQLPAYGTFSEDRCGRYTFDVTVRWSKIDEVLFAVGDGHVGAIVQQDEEGSLLE